MEMAKDKEFIDMLLPLLLIIFIIGVGVVLLYQHFQKNLYIQKLKEETLKTNYQNELLRSSIEAEEGERKRIAQDLHDELGAALSIMRMNIMMLEQKNNDAGNNLSGLANVRQLSETALASVRNISHRLMPPQLESFGLLKTLEAVIEQINGAGSLSVELIPLCALGDLSWTMDLTLYRVIMELINNTIKHSGASQAKIEFSDAGTHLKCVYTDNGRGLPEQSNRGLGLKSIEGRMRAVEGSLEYGNNIGGGILVTITIPSPGQLQPQFV